MLDIVTSLLPGIVQMQNIHPMLVHLPIALLTGFALMEATAVALRRNHLKIAADWMLYLGTLGAIAAVIAGLQAAKTVEHGGEVHAIMERHQALGLTVMALGVALSVWRLLKSGHFSTLAQFVHLMLAFAMVGTLTLGADLGGMMVYRYGLAVNPDSSVMVASVNRDGGGHSHDHGHAGAGIGHQVWDWVAGLVGQGHHDIRPHSH